MMVGNEFLFKELGITPTIGWQIDTFGHSNANPRLFAEMGFDAWFFSRLDYQDKERRLKDKEMEFVWIPFQDHLGTSSEIFTHVLYHHYNNPPGFCYDILCDDDLFIDDPTSDNFNAD